MSLGKRYLTYKYDDGTGSKNFEDLNAVLERADELEAAGEKMPLEYWEAVNQLARLSGHFKFLVRAIGPRDLGDGSKRPKGVRILTGMVSWLKSKWYASAEVAA